MAAIYIPSGKISGRGLMVLAASSVKRIDVVGTRKYFAVGNSEGAAGRILYIGGSDQVAAIAVYPQTTQVIQVDSEFYLLNPNLGTISCVVGEIIAADLGPEPTALRQGGGGQGGQSDSRGAFADGSGGGMGGGGGYLP